MRTIRTPEKRDMFLEALRREAGNVSAAANVAGLSRTAVYEWKQDDLEFSAEWESVVEETTDALEREVYRRAYEGVEKPVFYQGKEVGKVREYSDVLAMFTLKARRPDKYRDRHEVSNPDGTPLMQPIAEAIMKVYGSNAD